MHWLAFSITVVLTIVVQTAIAPQMRIAGVQPDFVLITVVFFALHGRGLDAVIAGWLLGFCADFQSVHRFGFLALSYGLVALGVYLIRAYLFRRNPLAHVFVTFSSGIVFYLLLLTALTAEAAIWGGWYDRQWGLMIWISLYSAVLAPLVQRVMLHAASTLGLETPNYTYVRAMRVV